MQVKESRWAEEISQRWKQPKGEDRAEMKNRGKAAEVHLDKWISVEYREEVHEKIRRKVRFHSMRTEHRLRKGEMEEQFNKEANEGWRIAGWMQRELPMKATRQ